MRWIILIGYATALAGVAGMGYGVWEVSDQRRMITEAVLVNATVVGQRVEKKVNKGFVQFTPLIDYEYTVAGNKYLSDRTFPTESLGPQKWAQDVVKAHPVGKGIRAYVVPDDPGRSFLIPKYGPLPYVTILVSFVFVGMGIGVAIEQMMHSDDLRVQSEGLGTVQLAAKHDDIRLAQLVGVVSMLGLLIGVPFALHHLLVATPPVSALFRLIAGSYVAAGLGLIGWAIHSHRIKGGFVMAPIEVTPGEPYLGEEFNVRLNQPVRFSGTIERLVMEVVLTRKNTALFDISRNADEPDPVLYTSRQVVMEDHPVSQDEVLEVNSSFLLPANLPPTSPPDHGSKIHFVWTLHVRGKSTKHHVLKRDYLLDIFPAVDR